jgi:hypothetical protein
MKITYPMVEKAARAMAREDDDEFGETAWEAYRGLAFIALRAGVGNDPSQSPPQPK